MSATFDPPMVGLGQSMSGARGFDGPEQTGTSTTLSPTDDSSKAGGDLARGRSIADAVNAGHHFDGHNELAAKPTSGDAQIDLHQTSAQAPARGNATHDAKRDGRTETVDPRLSRSGLAFKRSSSSPEQLYGVKARAAEQSDQERGLAGLARDSSLSRPRRGSDLLAVRTQAEQDAVHLPRAPWDQIGDRTDHKNPRSMFSDVLETPGTKTTLAQRFRRAVIEDDLPRAKALALRAVTISKLMPQQQAADTPAQFDQDTSSGQHPEDNEEEEDGDGESRASTRRPSREILRSQLNMTMSASRSSTHQEGGAGTAGSTGVQAGLYHSQPRGSTATLHPRTVEQRMYRASAGGAKNGAGYHTESAVKQRFPVPIRWAVESSRCTYRVPAKERALVAQRKALAEAPSSGRGSKQKPSFGTAQHSGEESPQRTPEPLSVLAHDVNSDTAMIARGTACFNIRNLEMSRKSQGEHAPSQALSRQPLPSSGRRTNEYTKDMTMRCARPELDGSVSSLALAVRYGAGKSMVEWLLDCGHERGGFTKDPRDRSVLHLAAAHNRPDIINACCIAAVAEAASSHHAQSAYVFPQSRSRALRSGSEGTRSLGTGEHHVIKDFASTPDDDSDSAQRSFATPSTSPNVPHQHLRKQHVVAKSAGSGHQSGPAQYSSPSLGYMEDLDAEDDDGEFEDSHRMPLGLRELLDWQDDIGCTALQVACIKGYEHCARLLLDLGADPDLVDAHGNSPLHHASSWGHLIVVQLLIERGCVFASKNTSGFTAGDYAYNEQCKEALEAFGRAQYEGRRMARKRGGDRSGDTAAPSSLGHGGA
ncbi:ankyrin [Ceraceosorus guamensis]|uniref:Ankyrin n=1 Tax=Ceraceosorus guamensis TaxID=1522189 RepID=A0A316VU25_9BASI|nr:ankyrin [Ceraceosorus guamensis]PWN41089.1 ankyrin [Ceraceosorus guamensis]